MVAFASNPEVKELFKQVALDRRIAFGPNNTSAGMILLWPALNVDGAYIVTLVCPYILL